MIAPLVESEKLGKKVFLVEDNIEVSRMYERAFRLAGHRMEAVFDGETALEKLTAPGPMPDAIVMDVMMPHMNGVDLLKAIHKDPRLSSVPVVVLTNSFYKEDAEKFLALGADLYLVKIEHQAKEVVEKVEALINSHHTKTI